jgi:hypothetical protein
MLGPGRRAGRASVVHLDPFRPRAARVGDGQGAAAVADGTTGTLEAGHQERERAQVGQSVRGEDRHGHLQGQTGLGGQRPTALGLFPFGRKERRGRT